MHREWITIAEAVERTGYNERHLQRLCHENASRPALDQRIRVDLTQNGYLIWWPSLQDYMDDVGRKPITD